METGYYPRLLTPKTMELLGSNKRRKMKDKKVIMY